MPMTYDLVGGAVVVLGRRDLVPDRIGRVNDRLGGLQLGEVVMPTGVGAVIVGLLVAPVL